MINWRRHYPMVMEELRVLCGGDVRRDMLPSSGPMVVDRTGLPYREVTYRDQWRQCANDVGVPKAVQLRDSRAGQITEAIEALDGNLEAARHHAGHSNPQTTARYSREADRVTAKVASIVREKRTANTMTNTQKHGEE